MILPRRHRSLRRGFTMLEFILAGILRTEIGENEIGENEIGDGQKR